MTPRVAIVAEQPATNGSTRYRALAYARDLRTAGLDVDVFVPPQIVRPAGPAGQVRFAAAHVRAYGAAARGLARALPRYDTLLVQRGAYPLGGARVVDAIRRFPGRVVFDLDDAVFLVSPDLAERSSARRWLYGPQQAAALLGRADAVVVSTSVLDELLPGRRADLVLPTLPEVDRHPLVAHSAPPAPLRVGWVGNAGNLRYLAPLIPVLDRLQGDGTIAFEAISSAPWNGPGRSTRWTEAEEPRHFGRFDVGIMPLPDLPYTRAKAGFKLLQYMASGSAVVASPVGVNARLVSGSGAGVLATTPHEWEQALRTLATDVERRAQMGSAGRRFVETHVDAVNRGMRILEATWTGVRP